MGLPQAQKRKIQSEFCSIITVSNKVKHIFLSRNHHTGDSEKLGRVPDNLVWRLFGIMPEKNIPLYWDIRKKRGIIIVVFFNSLGFSPFGNLLNLLKLDYISGKKEHKNNLYVNRAFIYTKDWRRGF